MARLTDGDSGRATLNIPATILLAGVGARQFMSFDYSPRFLQMKYLSLFSGIGTAEKGIEQAYERHNDHQHEPAKSGAADSITGRQRDTDIDGNGVRIADHSAFRRNAECIGFAEIDRFASSIYKYHWPDVRNYGDATAIVCDELPDFDFLVGGFPCQAFSIAGKRKGFQDTRGTLFFEIARILESKRPRHFLLENVAGLLSHDNGQTFRTIIATLDEIGYDTEWTVINSKHHGVPQNRERVFIIGHLRGRCSGEVLSFGEDGVGSVSEERDGWLQGSVSAETDGQCGSTDSTVSQDGCNGQLHSGIEIIAKDGTPKNRNIASTLTGGGHSGGHSGGNHSDMDLITVGTLRTHKDGQGFREMQSNVAPTLNARARADGSGQGVIAVASRGRYNDNGDIEQSLEPRFDGCTNSLTSVEKDNLVAITPPGTPQRQRIYGETGLSPALPAGATGGNNEPRIAFADRRIRRLTPTECERLQGLPDGHTKYGINNKSERYEVSDSQRYKTLGNAMTVNVISAVINKMLAVGCLK